MPLVISDRPRAPRWLLTGLAGVLFLAVVVVWWPGCREYPLVTSSQSMDLIKLLHVGCNMKDIVLVKTVESRLQTLEGNGGVSPRERKAFDKIVGLAHSSLWSEAERAALQFARDQVRR
jgi:hypothetical protein